MAQELINNNGLVIFSKSWCPYCTKVKNLFKELGVLDKAKVLELDLLDNGDKLGKELINIINKTSVPQVFIGKEHIGGCDDTHALHNKGNLVPKLKKALNY
eukprot:TRINITY_DN3281_c0_g1_i1.p1 TRINITY_DN3281_c0_g1~~TRINITY_DN3281_c0_g1_i1.p1  ORF type:complete len:101 (-),score=17.90 TRINITY_DN3281_c0_g1_i1:14-316(-)